MSYHNTSSSPTPSNQRVGSYSNASGNASGAAYSNTQVQVVPPGFHYMPDGTLMSDSEHARLYGGDGGGAGGAGGAGGTGTDRIYRTRVDLRALSNEIDIIFYVTGNIPITMKTMNKEMWLKLNIDLDTPVEMISVGVGDKKRVFLNFKAEGITPETSITTGVGSFYGDLNIELFKNTMGVYGFESIIGKEYGALLSHKNYYNVNNNNTKTLSGAIKKVGASHQIRMIMPGLRNFVYPELTFDMDIISGYGGQYTKTLGFRTNNSEDVVMKGLIPNIVAPRRITTDKKEVKFTTSYITMDSSAISTGTVLYDYKDELKSQDVEPETLELTNSSVYVIENNMNFSVDLSELKLGEINKIQIPYNISRVVNDGKIESPQKVIHKGKHKYQVDWTSEIRDNEIFSKAGKCMSFKFATKSQLITFAEKLKTQQIGNIETYPTYINGETSHVKRYYTDISQWVERASLNQFNDVRFTYDVDGLIDTILICPMKKANIGISTLGRQKYLTTSGGEFTLNGVNYVGGYHIMTGGIAMTGGEHSDNSKELIAKYDTTPISEFSETDFCFTNYGTKGGLYTAFTSGDSYSYDIVISGATYSAGTTVLPVSSIECDTKSPLIDDITQKYRAHAYSNVYGKNLNIDESATDYMFYSAQTNGIYRFTYKGYLNIDYTDTKWCDYINTTYPTSLVGVYPENNYEMKRLINTSIIKAGTGETKTATVDTDNLYYPGDRTSNTNGIKSFNFNVKLVKTSNSVDTVIKEYKVLRCSSDGVADEYLTINTTNMDKTSKGFGSCLSATTSATTIFDFETLVSVDSGFINVLSGDTIKLVYQTDWETTSKTGGTTNMNVSLGHKFVDGVMVETPWYRAIKASSKTVKKQLFFNQTTESKPFRMVNGDTFREVKMGGALYITDNGCATIEVPDLDSVGFANLSFVDTNSNNSALIWDIKSDKPTNNWQKLIEANAIKDYTIRKSSMCAIDNKGVLTFNIPQYNDKHGVTCDYTFPQTNHSYVIVNDFNNAFGKSFRHHIVVTPECGMYTPCTTEELISSYDILYKTSPDNRKVAYTKKGITIDGRLITIINPNTNNTNVVDRDSGGVRCEYYCSCGQDDAERLGIDPIYGVTKVVVDKSPNNCDDCTKSAIQYCKSVSSGCRVVMVEKCESYNNLVGDIISGKVIDTQVLPEVKEVSDTTTINTTNVVDYFNYNCVRGVCVRGDVGIYSSLDLCLTSCAGAPDPITTKRYLCSTSGCIIHKFGTYNTLDECIEVCREVGVISETTKTGEGETTTPSTRYSCKEGLCFEDRGGIYESLEKCVVKCEGTAKEKYEEDLKDVEVCEEKYYWCDTVKECIPYDKECPK